MLPLAMVGLVGPAIERGLHLTLDRRGQALLLWGGWLLSAGAFFGAGRFFHLYYLMMLAPAVAARAVAVLYQLVQRRFGRPAGLIAALVLAVTR